jgi:large subunit ribosomal protein L4
VNILKAFGIENKKSLFVLGDSNNNVYLSSRNLEGVKTVTNSGLNTYSVMNARKILIMESSLEGIESNLNK